MSSAAFSTAVGRPVRGRLLCLWAACFSNSTSGIAGQTSARSRCSTHILRVANEIFARDEGSGCGILLNWHDPPCAPSLHPEWQRVRSSQDPLYQMLPPCEPCVSVLGLHVGFLSLARISGFKVGRLLKLTGDSNKKVSRRRSSTWTALNEIPPEILRCRVKHHREI